MRNDISSYRDVARGVARDFGPPIQTNPIMLQIFWRPLDVALGTFVVLFRF